MNFKIKTIPFLTIQNRFNLKCIVKPFCCIGIALFLLISPLNAATYLGGFFESQYGVVEDGEFNWSGWSKHYLKLRLHSRPIRNLTIDTEVDAWTDDWRPRNLFNFKNLRMKYWLKPVNIKLFYDHQDHWVNSPLLNLVDSGVASHDWASSGLRISKPQIDGKFAGDIIFARAIYNTDDTLISRLSGSVWRSPYGNSSLMLGANILGRRWEYGNNEVVSGDFSFNRNRLLITGEYAYSSDEAYDRTKSDVAYEIEIRDFAVGPFFLTAAYYNYGKNFISRLSSRFNYHEHMLGREGIRGEFKFLLPAKAIDLIHRVGYSKASHNDEINDYTTVWNHSEVKIHFIRGISAKGAFETLKGINGTERGIFTQISAERRYVYFAFQCRLKDIGGITDIGERLIFAKEIRINLTENINFYFRNVNVQSHSRNWNSSFYQLNYFIGYNYNIFIEYGQSGHNDGLAFDGDVVDNKIDTVDMLRIMFQVNF